MEQRAVKSKRSPESDANCRDPHMLDAAVSQESFQVALHENEQPGNDNREETENQEQCVGKRRPDDPRDDGVVTQQSIESAIQQHRRQQSTDRRWSFRVRIGQPTVHRHKTYLGSISDEHEDEGELDQMGIEPRPWNRGGQRRPVQRHVRADARSDRAR